MSKKKRKKSKSTSVECSISNNNMDCCVCVGKEKMWDIEKEENTDGKFVYKDKSVFCCFFSCKKWWQKEKNKEATE